MIICGRRVLCWGCSSTSKLLLACCKAADPVEWNRLRRACVNRSMTRVVSAAGLADWLAQHTLGQRANVRLGRQHRPLVQPDEVLREGLHVVVGVHSDAGRCAGQGGAHVVRGGRGPGQPVRPERVDDALDLGVRQGSAWLGHHHRSLVLPEPPLSADAANHVRERAEKGSHLSHVQGSEADGIRKHSGWSSCRQTDGRRGAHCTAACMPLVACGARTERRATDHRAHGDTTKHRCKYSVWSSGDAVGGGAGGRTGTSGAAGDIRNAT